MSHILFGRRCVIPVAIVMGTLGVACFAPLSAQEDAEEQRKQEQIVQRFLVVLEKNPRRGTAFDKVYGHHVEWGTLDKFVQQLRERAAKTPTDGTGWMILGLVESQRGRDAAAVDAFTQAEQQLPQSAIASYYLGQAQVLAGKPDLAVAAFERAIERKPNQIDLLDIFQSLGRVHQRAQRTEQAMAVWSRLETLFPNDARVQEQIAITLVEEGQFVTALPRYERLVQLTKDEYRRTVFRQEVAELKVRLGKTADAVADLESILGQLNPDSWLFRDVRRRIEDVFLRTEDQDGLAKYYERWLGKQTQDVDAMARLSRVLARQARMPEAQQWLEKALKIAPTRRDLRLAFIDQLVDDGRFSDAVKQYEALDQAEPNNPDVLREWGKLVLRDTTIPEAERRQQAEKVWRRLVTARPKDPLVATQVADLLRHADLKEQALELYRQAVELAPNQPQYREYLGEFYHLLKRRDEALATWRAIAEGKQRTAANLGRLAEVLSGFGYLNEALPEVAVACQLDPKDFSLQLKGADLCYRAEKYADSLQYLAAAEKLAANPDESETVLVQQLRIYQADGSLADRTKKLSDEVTADKVPASAKWYLLARLHEAQRQYPQATTAIGRALQLDAKSLSLLSTAARIHEQAGDWKTAADTNRQLANLDRRLRTTYLTNVARLESQLGRIEESMQAGRDLIAAAPGNAENHTFFAQLCFRLGRLDEGLDTLRRAVRANPTDPQLTITLAQSLAEQFRTDESIELYWQAFDRSTDMEVKLNCIPKLTELYLQTNRFDKLLERLERSRREAEMRREMTICLAQAYHSSGDFGQARVELEGLLSTDTRDTQLLQQLSKLSEEEGDLQAAVKFQEQVAKLAPGPESEYRLANLLQRVGSTTQSREILTRLALREEDPVKVLRNLDALLSARQYETVLTITESKLRESPKNWELLYREGVALASVRPTDAGQRFQAIIDMMRPDDEPGATLAEERKKPATKRTPVGPAAARSGDSLTGRTLAISSQYQIRQAIGLDTGYYDPFGGYSSARQTMWTPAIFGQARFAALAWQYKFADKAGQREAFLAARKQASEAANASASASWDWIFLLQLSNQSSASAQPLVAQVAKKLAKAGDPDAQQLFLSTMQARLRTSSQPNAGTTKSQPNSQPLNPDDLDLAMECYRQLAASTSTNPNVAYAIPNIARTLVQLLRQANRNEEATKLLEELLQKSTGPQRVHIALMDAMLSNNQEALKTAVDDWSRETKQELSKIKLGAPPSTPSQASIDISELPRLIGKLGPAKEHAAILQILDTSLEFQLASRRQQSATPPRSIRPQGQRYQTSIVVWYGDQSENQTIEYYNGPSSSSLDYYSTQVIRNAFHVFKRNESLPELFNHVQKWTENAGGSESTLGYLLLSTLHGWNGDQQEANAQYAKATAAAPADISLRFESALRLMQSQQFDEALSLLEAFSPQDQNAMQQRESLVLDLAVRLGDTDRARLAAERLFGLRLSAEEQIRLAGYMRRLGLNEMADAVMARAQRQAGNRMAALVALMGQYQSEGKADLAVQVAHQILRRTQAGTATSSTSFMVRDDGTRRAALQCLQQSGRLKDLIARSEAQLKTSPGSTVLLETLAEYYTAAGEREKAATFEAKLIEQTPDDPVKRYQLAERLANSGKHAEACKHFAAAFKQDPRLLQRGYSYAWRSFQQSNNEAEFAKLLNEIDLKAIGQPYVISNLISNMLSRGNSDSAGARKLFQRAWEAYPNDRQRLVSGIYNEDFWSHPEMGQLLRESLFPSAASLQQDPWHGLQANSYSSDGTMRGLLSVVLKGVKDESALRKLREEIAASVQKFPEWRAGQLLLAVLDARTGKTKDAKEVFEAQLKDLSTIPGQVARVIAQELEPRDELRDVCLRLYEHSMANGSPVGGGQFQYTAGRRLVEIYAKVGRNDDARALLRKAAQEPIDGSNDPEYAVYARIEKLQEIGQLYLTIEKPVDAAQVFRSMFAIASSPEARASRYGSSFSYYLDRGRTGMQQALSKIRSNSLQVSLPELLSMTATDSKSPPSLDLFISLAETRGGENKLDSLLLNLVLDAKVTEEDRVAIAKRVRELRVQYPQEINCCVVDALFRRSPEPAAQRVAFEELLKIVENTALETIAAGQRPSSKQRQDAERQLGLWFVARDCLQKPELMATGQKLGERALAAAERQIDSSYALAILYEWGELAAKNGNVKLAGEKWGSMLDLVLANSRVQRPAASPSPGKLVPSTTPPTPNVPTTSPRSGPIPLTESQFVRVMHIADLTAVTVPDVSARAVQVAFAGGPPVPDIGPSADLISGVRTRIVTSSTGQSLDLQANAKVITELTKVVTKWQAPPFPAAFAYETLHSIAICPARPKELMIYEMAIGSGSPRDAKHIGRFLIPAAIRAGRSQDLERDLIEKKTSPQAELQSLVLLFDLHLATGNRDAAKEDLRAIQGLITKQASPSTINLATHAAARVLDDSELCDIALPTLQLAIKTFGASFQSSSSGNTSISRLLARNAIRAGDTVGAKTQLDAEFQSRAEAYSNYSGDYPLYIQRQCLAESAALTARGGMAPLTLEFLGRCLDIPRTASYGEPSFAVPLWNLERILHSMPPQARYELLRDWTLPQPNRRTIRIAVDFVPALDIPDGLLTAIPPAKALAEAGGDSAVRHRPEPDVPLSNILWLVDAARESKQLDELRRLSEAAIKEQIPGSLQLLTLSILAAEDLSAAEPRLREVMSAAKQRAETPVAEGRRRPPLDPVDFLVMRAALHEPSLNALGRRFGNQLLEHVRSSYSDPYITHIGLELSRAEDTLSPDSPAPDTRDPELKYWFSYDARQGSRGMPAAWWAAHDGFVAHRTGHTQDTLGFRYPLTGEFEFSFDVFADHFATGEVGYGGLVCVPEPWAGRSTVWPWSQRETLTLPPPVEAFPGINRRTTVQIAPGKTRFLMNGRLIFEDTSAGQSSPWLELVCLGSRTTAFWNPRLTGHPVIPREVVLLADDRFDGWFCPAGGQLPLRLTANEANPPNTETRPDDWVLKEGVLRTTPRSLSGESDPTMETLLSYHRPLQSGESIQYEFFYEPRNRMVHPAIGSLAFIVSNQQIQLHWIAGVLGRNELFDLPVKKKVSDPEAKSVPTAILLKENAWNRMQVSLHGDDVKLHLNGTEVFQRRLEPANDRRFGFYQDIAAELVEVRSVTLQGNWPERLSSEDTANLFAVARPAATAREARIRHTTVGELFYLKDIYGVWQASMKQSGADRYEALARWVLPSDSHPTFRLQAVTTPVDPISEVAAVSARIDARESRNGMHRGGELVAPAIELVRVAQAINKVDELAKRVQQAPASTDLAKRSQVALQVLIAIAREDDRTAQDLLLSLVPIAAAIDAAAPAYDRFPELVAVWESLQRPALRGAALQVADLLVEQQQGDGKYVSATWERLVRHVRSRARWLTNEANAGQLFGAPPGLKQWSPVSFARAETRGNGFPVSAWRVTRGEVEHFPGHAYDSLYFRLPLQGDFEVHCERSTYGWREIRVGYGTISVDPTYDAKSIWIRQVGRSDQQVKLDNPIPNWGEWVKCRIVVKAGTMTTFLNEMQVHSCQLPSDDPWLFIQTSQPQVQGTVRNLRVVGSPTIPKSLQLSKADSLVGWWADYFGQSTDVAADAPGWRKSKDEIVAARLEKADQSYRESLLQYHRSIAEEDGELAYEFYYAPGKTECHPAFGRQVLLLRPEGIKLHWLTDGAYERSGLSPANENPLQTDSDSGKLPLKENDWNQLRLILKGDSVTVELNGTKVAEQMLAPSNERTFGLFHYQEQTNLRVRNVTYRGDWPTTLPAIADQELAIP